MRSIRFPHIGEIQDRRCETHQEPEQLTRKLPLYKEMRGLRPPERGKRKQQVAFRHIGPPETPVQPEQDLRQKPENSHEGNDPTVIERCDELVV